MSVRNHAQFGAASVCPCHPLARGQTKDSGPHQTMCGRWRGCLGETDLTLMSREQEGRLRSENLRAASSANQTRGNRSTSRPSLQPHFISDLQAFHRLHFHLIAFVTRCSELIHVLMILSKASS